MNWECPYCRKAQIVTAENMAIIDYYLNTSKILERNNYLRGIQIRCLSADCDNLTTSVTLHKATRDSLGHLTAGRSIKTYRIEPNAACKIFSAEIHSAILQDYAEACAIVDASPKAAATLARRCLQGMIRDSCQIVKGTLAQQINELRDQVGAGKAEVRHVDIESLEAIDALRSIGNIGAHMEKDINVIVDVDPDEARLLIDLIESLLESWYVERQKRVQRYANVTALAAEKASQRKPAPPPQAVEHPSEVLD